VRCLEKDGEEMMEKTGRRILNIKIAAGFVFAIFCLSSLPAYGREVEVKISFDKKEYHKFDPVILSVKIKNVSNDDVALCAGISPEENDRWSNLLFYGNYEQRRLSAKLCVQDDKHFFILKAGEYIKGAIDASKHGFSKSYMGYLDNKDEEWSVCISLEHKLNKGLDDYNRFARDHNAIAWIGKVNSNTCHFKFVCPRDNSEIRLQNMWQKNDTGETRLSPSYPWDFFRNNEKLLYEEFPNHRNLNYWFWYNNRFESCWRPWLPSHLHESCEKLKDWLEHYVSYASEIIESNWRNEINSPINDELLWNKLSALYALGRDSEADILKDDIVAKEPERNVEIEKEWMEYSVSRLKEFLAKEQETGQPYQLENRNSENKQNETVKQEVNNPAQYGIVSSDIGEKAVIEREEGIYKEEIRDIDEPKNKPQESNPLIIISVFVLGAVGAFVVIAAIRSRRMAGKR